tara:strand:- start:134 stop:796 length:663 start_codon:yes stop_codon:yes gene_type:complete
MMLSDDGILSIGVERLLEKHDLQVLVVRSPDDLDLSETSNKPPSVALLDQMSATNLDISECIDKCAALKIPVMLLISNRFINLMNQYNQIEDFIIAPFSEEELIARVKLVIVKNIPPLNENTLRIGRLSINQINYEVRLNNSVITLRYKEYELLRLLASNPEKVFSRESLLNQIWGYEYFGGTRTVDVHIRRIRSKIENAKDLKIETVWNVGYRLTSKTS